MQIAYIHGFLSGSQALKSQLLKKALSERYPQLKFLAPNFPDTPQEAYQSLQEFCRQALNNDQLALVASSMGGFFATLLSIEFKIKAVLLNPCIHPQDYFDKLIGPQVNPYTDNHFELTPQMLPFLESLDARAQAFDAKLIRVYLESGDEVLDYTKSLSFFSSCRPIVIEGGAHIFKSFAQKIDEIVTFLKD